MLSAAGAKHLLLRFLRCDQEVLRYARLRRASLRMTGGLGVFKRKRRNQNSGQWFTRQPIFLRFAGRPPPGEARLDAPQWRAQSTGDVPRKRCRGRSRAPTSVTGRQPDAPIQRERHGAADTVAHAAADDATQRLRSNRLATSMPRERSARQLGATS